MDIKTKFEQVVQALNERKERKKQNVNEMANQLGISRTQVYTLLAGKLFRKNGKREFSDAVIIRLYSELVLQANPVEIGSFRFLLGLSGTIQNEAKMMCATGKPGLGKSTALKYIANTKPNVYYALCDHLDSTEDFITRIYESFGLESLKLKGKRKRKAMIGGIAEYVSKQEQTPLVILDDIHHLGIGVYRDLKLLFDKTEGMMGILLVGTPELEFKLKKWAGYDIDWQPKYNPKNIMPELVRRFKDKFLSITELVNNDLELICEHYKIKDKKRIANYFIKKPYLELGMFTEKLERTLKIAKPQNLEVT